MSNPLMNTAIGSISQADIAQMTAMKSALASGGYTTQAAMEASTAGLDTIFDGRVIVSKAENGFVVTVALRLGARYKTYVAADMDEVNALLTAIMVDFRLTEGKR